MNLNHSRKGLLHSTSLVSNINYTIVLNLSVFMPYSYISDSKELDFQKSQFVTFGFPQRNVSFHAELRFALAKRSM
jgi:hypothetical protein